MSDTGYLGNPYRAARVFGAAVPENVPRTRSSRAFNLRAIGDLGNRDAVRGSYRYFWDNWDVRAHTFEAGYSRYVGESFLFDGFLRHYRQEKASFYSDDAQSQTQFVTRNRQLGTYDGNTLGGKVTYSWKKVPGQYEIKFNGALELLRLPLQRLHRPAHRFALQPVGHRAAAVRDRHLLKAITMSAFLRSLAVLAAFALFGLAAQAQQQQPPTASASLDTRVQDLKSDVIKLNRDLLVLEEELLFPAGTQVAVFVSMDVGKLFELDSLQVKLNDKLVTNYLYTPNEVQALHRGGVQRAFVGNLKSGTHEIVAFFTGKGPHTRDYKRGTTIKFDKGQEPKYIELRIKDSTGKLQPEFDVKVWQ